MGKLRFKIGSITAVCAAVLGLGAAPVVAAPAPANLQVIRWLTSNPNSGMASIPLHRDIYLDPANYNWQVFVCQEGWSCIDPGRDLDLKPGWYSWDCTLIPLNGYYSENCSLETAGWPKAKFNRLFVLANSGNYNIGSSLKEN
ncbi:hypothetical protein ACIQU4_38815 [Streptomyces sp. NPDC090741]|uniref:hypothetical protein n=1 Tax=Streptomyces sp. NPDC090741 TaxID=3365967 RepID=UPI00381DFFE8